MSFRHRLVLYFSLLALVPLVVSFYGDRVLVRRADRQRLDSRVAAELRAVSIDYGRRVAAAATEARLLARQPALVHALVAGDRRAAAAALAGVPGAGATTDAFTVGAIPAVGAAPRVVVAQGGKRVGAVFVAVPVDDETLARLESDLAPGDRIAAIRGGQIIAGLGRGATAPPAGAATISLAGARYRVNSTGPASSASGFRFLVAASAGSLSSAVDATDVRLAVAFAGSLVLFGVVAYLIGRSIVRTLRSFVGATEAIVEGRLDLRVPERGEPADEFDQLARAFNRMSGQLEQRLAEVDAERLRVRDVAAGFGRALAATHDEPSLLHAIAESAVRASGGIGAVVRRDGEVLVRAGTPAADAEHLSFPLRDGSTDYGTLVVHGDQLETHRVELVAALAQQAVTALGNARRHTLAEQQALVDELTGIGNRRALDLELRTRTDAAAAGGDRFALVLADLDRFKGVNDRYGHPAGDRVLVHFAALLESVLRDVDVAGRWGGEEFALILSGANAETAAEIAERARVAAESAPADVGGGVEIPVTASFGVAAWAGHEPDELVEEADAALYRAKANGRNRVERAVPAAS